MLVADIASSSCARPPAAHMSKYAAHTTSNMFDVFLIFSWSEFFIKTSAHTREKTRAFGHMRQFERGIHLIEYYSSFTGLPQAVYPQ